jgi:pyrimidine-nucleoside phosphorylase
MAAPLAPLEVIERSRRGDTVDAASVESFVRAWLDGTAGDAQMAAWCMVACLRGLARSDVEGLTRALLASGQRLELTSLAPTGDTHSTGGVGDSVTLVAAPLAASLGVRVATMSGRGLAHTGGTIDKLEAIPGFEADLPLDRFVRQVRDTGIAVVSQASRLTPGEGRLFALRDATGTVPSAGLIAASIMSKVLAGGAGAIVLDVKAGSGAFFPDAASAREAAELMTGLAEPWGRPVRWLVTAMDQPLGRCVGNALEVGEAAEVLRGGGPPDLRDLAVLVAGHLAEAAGVADEGEGGDRARHALRSGAALEAAERWVEAQGGDPEVWTDPGLLPSTAQRHEVAAPSSGWLSAIEARGVGEAARWLGAGRLHADQAVDHAVGIELLAKVGDRVEAGRAVARIHGRDSQAAARAGDMVGACLGISEEPVEPPPLVLAEGRGRAGAS